MIFPLYLPDVPDYGVVRLGFPFDVGGLSPGFCGSAGRTLVEKLGHNVGGINRYRKLWAS